MTFSTLIDGFKGFFSRSFWFGSFLPVAIVAAAHLWLSALIFNAPTYAAIGEAISDKPGLAVFVFVGLIIFAYALGPITSMLSGLLDGSLLPAWLHDRLRGDRAEAWREQVAQYKAARDDFAALADPDFAKRLRAADKGPRDPNSVEDEVAIPNGIATVETMLEDLEAAAQKGWNKRLDPTRPVDVSGLKTACAALIAVWNGQIEALGGARPAAEWLKRANAARLRIFKLQREARTEAAHRFTAVARRAPNLDMHDWQATRFGDARYARDRYVRDTYGVSFAYLWPKVRMAIGDGEADDSKGPPRTVADSAALVDFTVLLLVLGLTIPAVWLPLILGYEKSVWAFLAIGIAAPIAVVMLYELLVRSEMAFGEVVQTVVDRYHLAIFPMLGLAAPPTLSAEREIWSRLEKAGWSGANIDLVYKSQAVGGG